MKNKSNCKKKMRRCRERTLKGARCAKYCQQGQTKCFIHAHSKRIHFEKTIVASTLQDSSDKQRLLIKLQCYFDDSISQLSLEQLRILDKLF